MLLKWLMFSFEGGRENLRKNDEREMFSRTRANVRQFSIWLGEIHILRYISDFYQDKRPSISLILLSVLQDLSVLFQIRILLCWIFDTVGLGYPVKLLLQLGAERSVFIIVLRYDTVPISELRICTVIIQHIELFQIEVLFRLCKCCNVPYLGCPTRGCVSVLCRPSLDIIFLRLWKTKKRCFGSEQLRTRLFTLLRIRILLHIKVMLICDHRHTDGWWLLL